jgi:hypothetical protein
LRKLLLGDGKLIMGLKTIANQVFFRVGIRRNSSLRPVILYGCEDENRFITTIDSSEYGIKMPGLG